MGKSQRRNRLTSARQRAQPTVPHVEEPNGTPTPATGEVSFLARISSDLQDVSTTRRQAAAVRFVSWLAELKSNSSKESEAMKLARSPELIQLIPNLLAHVTEKNAPERHSILSAISSISSMSPEMCEELVKSDALTPLIASIELFSQSIIAEPKWDAGCKSLLKTINALTNLCCNSPEAVAIVMRNSSTVLPFLTQCLTHRAEMIHIKDKDVGTEPEKDFNHSIAIEAAKYLEVLFEDQEMDQTDAAKLIAILHEVIGSEENWQVSLGISALQVAYLRITCSSVLFNVTKSSLKPNPAYQDYLVKSQILIADLASKILLVDCEPAVSKLLEAMKNSEDNQLIYEVIRYSSLAKQAALEGLCNVICDEDEEETAEEMDCDSENSGDDGDEIVEELLPTNSTCSPSMSPQLLAHITKGGLFIQIVSSLSIIPPEREQSLESHFIGKMVLELLIKERERTLSCISTILSVVPLHLFQDSLHILTTQLTEIGRSLSGKPALVKSGEYFRALSRVAASPLSFSQIGMDSSTFGALCSEIVTHSDGRVDFSVRCHAIHAIAKMASKPDAPPVFVEDSGKFLGGILEEFAKCDPSAMTLDRLTLVGEVLDAIMDIFADDGMVNEILNRLSLLPLMKTVSQKFSKQVKFYLRNKELTRKSPLMDVKSNLSRFIDYKNKHGV